MAGFPNVGDTIQQYDAAFEAAFEEPIEILNFIEGTTPDNHGDYPREPHPDNPIQTTGQVEQPDDPTQEQDARGAESSVDAEILVPDRVLITEGGMTDSAGNRLAWPSEIHTGDRIYTVLSVYDEGNGRLMCLARDSGSVDD